MAQIFNVQMSNSNFQEISDWDDGDILRRFFPPGTRIVYTENSDIILIIERDARGNAVASLLDRLALIISHAKDKYFKAVGKRPKMTKDDVQKIANVLRDQSKKLEGMSVTYRLMASALLASKDNFADVVKYSDEHIKKILDNPFD